MFDLIRWFGRMIGRTLTFNDRHSGFPFIGILLAQKQKIMRSEQQKIDDRMTAFSARTQTQTYLYCNGTGRTYRYTVEVRVSVLRTITYIPGSSCSSNLGISCGNDMVIDNWMVIEWWYTLSKSIVSTTNKQRTQSIRHGRRERFENIRRACHAT
jgi:hypothetical protein